MSVQFITYEEGERVLDWLRLTEALAEGHQKPKAQIGDTFLYRDPDTLLSRAAWIDGMGMAVKTATIFPGNREVPSINGGVSLYSDGDGTLEAMIDFHLVTKWKTAGDSLLAALRLAPGAEHILIVGAGTVARAVREAFGAGFTGASFTVWNRTRARAAEVPVATVADDLETAVRAADIVVGCTMATEPWLRGDWLRAGQHVNLIGAYRPDMREADDAALKAARVFVDSFDTTLAHIGELKIPLEARTIDAGHVRADFYNLSAFTPGGLTLFKNGGGAHLDLITARHIFGAWQA